MSKKEFIKLLEQKLDILDENELKDIINEYKDTIDEKVKHGKTEEEAVDDFGSIDELAKEILKAYKINPKYGEKRDNVKEVINDCESLIKRSARKLANFSKSVVDDFKNNNNNLTVELIFEILIKGILLLVLFAILRLPFEFINYLGESILDIAFYPLDRILIFVWKVVLFFLYIVCCGLISIAMFKQYFSNERLAPKETKNKKEAKKKVVENKSEVNRKEETIIVKESVSSVIGKILKVVFQIFVILVGLVPLWMMIFGVVIVFVLSVYYLCIGINTVGILIGSIGVGVLLGYIANIFHSIAFNRKKVYFFPFIISLVLIAVGSLLAIDMITHVNYIEDIPKNDFSKVTDKYEFEINKPIIIHTYQNTSFKIDDTLEDNKMKVRVTYYDEFGKVTYIKDDDADVEYDYINFYNSGVEEYNNNWKMYNLVIDNLKKNKFYQYDSLYDWNVEVYANEKTMKLIKEK